jgi:energy-coupling factor transporter ATPase
MIEFDRVSFSYPGSAEGQRALFDVTLSLEAGETLAVLGGNGSGKSTLGLHANGLLLPSAGRVEVDGLDTADDSHAHEVRSRVGMAFQNPDNQIVSTSVEEDVAFGPENLGLPRAEIRRRVDDALGAVGLVGMESREPHLLSGGQKQRLAIAGVLALSPRYLVLDEPGSMLDETSRRGILELVTGLREAGAGVLLITHDLTSLAIADRVLVLDQGRVAFEGSTSALFERHDALSAWGLEVPPVAQLVAVLRERGVELDRTESRPEAIVEALAC